MKNILVTGGAGFIGSNFIRYVFEKTDFQGNIVNYDALTYAGNYLNLEDIGVKFKDRYVFVKGDIRDTKALDEVFEKYEGQSLLMRGPYGNGFDVSLYKDGEVIVVAGGTVEHAELSSVIYNSRIACHEVLPRIVRIGRDDRVTFEFLEFHSSIKALSLQVPC